MPVEAQGQQADGERDEERGSADEGVVAVEVEQECADDGADGVEVLVGAQDRRGAVGEQVADDAAAEGGEDAQQGRATGLLC